MADPSVLSKTGFDQSGKYEFGDLEDTYGGFLAPTFLVSIGGTVLDSTKIPISSITVEMETDAKCGGCSLTLESLYDYETGKWAEGLLDTIAIGQSVAVAGGYAEKQKLLFKGFVNEFSIDYSSSGAPRLNVKAVDGLKLLMNNVHERDFTNETAEDVVLAIIQDCLDAGVVSDILISGIPTTFTAQFKKPESISDFEYLKQLAQKCSLTFTVINDQLIYSNELLSNKTPLITLTMGVSLYSFSKRLEIGKGAVGSVLVQSVDREQETRYVGEATSPDIDFGEGQTAAAKATAFGITRLEFTDSLLKSNDECVAEAQAIMNSLALTYVNGSGTCIGIPDIIPGRFITLAGLDSKTNGLYFISHVTHKFTGQGYFTDFSVRGVKSQ